MHSLPFLSRTFSVLAWFAAAQILPIHGADSPASWVLNPPDLETVVLEGEGGAYNVHVTSDGGYVVAGCIATEGRGRDMVVYKLRSDLSPDPAFGQKGKWVAGSTGTDQAIDAIEVHGPNGKADGYLVLGYATAGDGDFAGCGYHGKSDLVVARLTVDGQRDPNFGHDGIRMYGGKDDDILVQHDTNFSEPGDRIVQTEGGFLLAGMTRSKDGDLKGIKTVGWQADDDAMIFKIDGHGDLVPDFGDHGILRIGNKPGPKMGRRSPKDFVWSLKVDPSGGFVASGFHYGIGLPIDGTMTYSPGNSSNLGDNTSAHVEDHNMDGWMFRFDDHGNLRKEWADHGFVYLGGSRQEKLYDVAPTADGGYVVCGRTASSDLAFSRPGRPEEFDAVLVKVAKDGKLDLGFAGKGVCFLGGGGDQASRVLTYEGDMLCMATCGKPRPELPLPPHYDHQVLMIRLTAQGEPRRYWSLGKEGQDWPAGMAIDREGRVVIVGYHGAPASTSEKRKKGKNKGRSVMIMRFRPGM